MSHHRTVKPHFSLTAPQSCPYLPGKVERKLFTALNGEGSAQVNDQLSQYGFRRSQNVAYRPACPACSACCSTRIPVGQFKPTRAQRRALRRNKDLKRSANAPWATEDQYALFSRYLASRHAAGGMSDMGLLDYAAMVEDTPVRTRVIEYHAQDECGIMTLVAACLTDILSDGLSMVYSFFEPNLATRSLGAYMILDHLNIAREACLPYVYLGYWITGSPKMDYKIRYRPLEVLSNGAWHSIEKFRPASTEGAGD